MAILKDVEPDIIFRHIVWSVLFVAAVAYYVNIEIMPNVAAYKEQVRFTRVTQSVLASTKAVRDNAQEKINAFSGENYEQIKVFTGVINEAMIRKNLPKGFLRINVKKTKEEMISEEQLKKQFYVISGEVGINNLALIFDIIPKLHDKSISAILELPFIIQKTKKGNLAFEMSIAITQSTYNNSNH